MNLRGHFRWIGPVLAVATGFLCDGADMPRSATFTAAITVLCAMWWITEALPIPVTSLVPLAAFPLLGVTSGKQVAVAYGHPMILLLLGGFILSKAVESSGAHERLAIGMVRLFGRFGRRGLVLGFMSATAMCSMWISNSATALMMLPVAAAVLAHEQKGDLAAPLMLGIAYAASIGGLGTPVGTPPNILCISNFEKATGQHIDFAEWMSIGVPVVIGMIPIAWWILMRKVERGVAHPPPPVGTWRRAEIRVLIVFGLTAIAWIFRSVPSGGWVEWLGIPGAGEETVALTAVIACFLIPTGDGDGRHLLEWDVANEIPWGILLLFAGGIAIADAFETSGLSRVIGDHLVGVVGMGQVAVVALLCLVVTFLTEVTSNTATTALLMPILASAALRAQVDPRLLMVPAALSASCAFMLPVATAPNAIVFGTGRVTIPQMARAGFRLNLAGVLVVGGVVLLRLG